MSSPSDSGFASSNPVRAFRARTTRQKIHPRESVLAWIVALLLVFLPWAYGGVREWGQWIGFGLSLAAFGVALVPRDYDEAMASGQAPFRLYTWSKLLRFPFFWGGLIFFAYIATQALNPAWRYVTDGKGWWMEAVDHLTWLPSGVEAPFSIGGPWRMLLIYSTVWLVTCALWIGITRRRTFQWLFTVLVANGFLLACIGMLQRLKGNGKILWLFEPPTSYYVATILYKNHAAAYFNILLGLAAGIGFWHYTRNLRRLEKSSPAGIFAFFATAIAVIVLFSFSRAGTLLMLALTVALLAVFVFRQVRAPAEQRSPLSVAIIVLLLGSFVWLGAYSMRLERVTESIDRLFNGDREASIEYRETTHQATWEMAQDRVGLGWGAGSFRFYFPVYQQKHPQIFRDPGGRGMYWEHAHNDYLEWLAELGLVGCAIGAFAVGSLGWHLLKAHALSNPMVLFGALGLLTTLLHAWVDFPFQNPAILTTWCALLLSLGRWAELEELNSRS